ncbi:SCO2322 family protein [Streptomyces sp. A3M-1-3]|uniref:SCO2322 family protein n=1 Tax=Streptomyces sp. A3M-1-3 TaxID=2962044 RepID=UPI0020B8EC98|nr:SCO2322 family protein [Streptomyces sp. A3M-1-3]MCP3816625.1 SCO2322 family protein [Streptomyces sp. A3M-1-3]
MRTRIAAFVLALGTLLTVLGAGPAHAAGYRYWSFWERDGGAWKYATQGPSLARPADGDVQGFRFSVSEDSQDAAQPRGAADFGAICGGTPARDGQKRVALVIDFGTRADAPGGETPPATRTECAQVGADATSADALAAVAKPLRYNSDALLCAIAGYPEAGCGEQVPGDAQKSPAPVPDEAADGGGPSAGLLAGIAAVLALGAAGAWQARRRRGQS